MKQKKSSAPLWTAKTAAPLFNPTVRIYVDGKELESACLDFDSRSRMWAHTEEVSIGCRCIDHALQVVAEIERLAASGRDRHISGSGWRRMQRGSGDGLLRPYSAYEELWNTMGPEAPKFASLSAALDHGMGYAVNGGRPLHEEAAAFLGIALNPVSFRLQNGNTVHLTDSHYVLGIEVGSRNVGKGRGQRIPFFNIITAI